MQIVEAVNAYAKAAGLPLDAAQYVANEIAVLLGQGMLTLYGEPLNRPAFDSARVSPYSRWHAARSNVVTNVLHGLVQLTPEQAQIVKSPALPSAAHIGELMTLGLLV